MPPGRGTRPTGAEVLADLRRATCDHRFPSDGPGQLVPDDERCTLCRVPFSEAHEDFVMALAGDGRFRRIPVSECPADWNEFGSAPDRPCVVCGAAAEEFCECTQPLPRGCTRGRIRREVSSIDAERLTLVRAIERIVTLDSATAYPTTPPGLAEALSQLRWSLAHGLSPSRAPSAELAEALSQLRWSLAHGLSPSRAPSAEWTGWQPLAAEVFTDNRMSPSYRPRVQCKSRCEFFDDGEAFRCSRTAGHAGLHVAEDPHDNLEWDDDAAIREVSR